MLTKLIVKNFKRFRDVEVELGNPVVFIGPNDSGKTTALQAIALWSVGVGRWTARRKGGTASKRPGVTINRKDLISLPVPEASLLWHDLHVRDVFKKNGKQQTKNIRVDITVEGVTEDVPWSCGLEFDYANEESFYCRPLRTSDDPDPVRMPIPEQAAAVRIAFLPPMSGLAANETRLDPGAINVRIGEGRTAEVLRNLCFALAAGRSKEDWKKVVDHIKALFGVDLTEPKYIPDRGEVEMSYRDPRGTKLDLSSSGRGLQQTLLLLAYLYQNPGAVILLDEPDAHLEILRQRQIYQLLTDVAREQGCQIIAASHSEIVLNEAADRDVVVAFVGKPHRIDDRGNQVLKALKEIGYEHYYLGEQKRWVLYLEGSTDLAVMRAFARTLNHKASRFLEQPFFHAVGNQTSKARSHFAGIKEAVPGLAGIALYDRLDLPATTYPDLTEMTWQRNEIENYLCHPDALRAYAAGEAAQDLFGAAERQGRMDMMEKLISDRIPPAALRDWDDAFWVNTKASDNLLDPLFESYFQELGLPNMMRKTDYHQLALLMPAERILGEVVEKLDVIAELAERIEGGQFFKMLFDVQP